MNASDRLATIVAILSAVFALTMAVAMLLLIVRRSRIESRTALRESQELKVSRYLVAAMAGKTGQAPDGIPLEIQRAALAHYLMLVRGKDRERLLAIAERDGLFRSSLARLSDRRIARRIDAIHELEEFASPECIEALELCLYQDAAPLVRLEAALSLARLERPPAPEALIETLELKRSSSKRIHAALFRAVAEGHQPALLRLAQDPDNQPMLPLLVEAIGWTQDFAAAERLAPFSMNPDPEVRASAIRAARHLGHPSAGRWILPLIDDPSEMVRVQAARACGELGIVEAVPALERHVADSAWWVRNRVRSALELLRPHRPVGLNLVSPAS